MLFERTPPDNCFFCEIYIICKNKYFVEHVWTVASDKAEKKKEKEFRMTLILFTNNRSKSSLWHLQVFQDKGNIPPHHKSWTTLIAVLYRDLKAAPFFFF